MPTRDERPLAELRFANHILDFTERLKVETKLIAILKSAGVEVAQDIIDMGCTGIFDKVANAHATTRFILENIGGSGTGLPCYVPPNKFCLIHNCVGGREPGQKGLAPHAGMMRDLTDEEKKNSSAVRILTEQQVVNELKTHFGAEVVGSSAGTVKIPGEQITGRAVDQFHLQNVQGMLICGEHDSPSLGCKYCVVQAILARESLVGTNQLDPNGTTRHYYLGFTTRIEFVD